MYSFMVNYNQSNMADTLHCFYYRIESVDPPLKGWKLKKFNKRCSFENDETMLGWEKWLATTVQSFVEGKKNNVAMTFVCVDLAI